MKDQRDTGPTPALAVHTRSGSSSGSERLLIRAIKRLHLTNVVRISDTQRPSNRPSLAARLPDEILISIFRNLQRVHVDSGFVLSGSQEPKDVLRATRLVCKAWYPAATAIFFERVQLFECREIELFLELLKDPDAVHVRSLVRTLIVPSRVGNRMPSCLRRDLAKMVNMLEDLRILDFTCPVAVFGNVDERKQTVDYAAEERPFVLPIAQGKHANLTSLSIHSDVYNPSTFPYLLTHAFPRLEHLALDDFWLAYDVSPLTTPPLTRLKHFEFSRGSSVWRLDEWLLACPMLQKVTLRGTDICSSPLSPPLKLFTEETSLKTLELIEMNIAWDAETQLFQWLDECPSIEELTLDVSMDEKLTTPLSHTRKKVTLRWGQTDLPDNIRGQIDQLIRFFPAYEHEMMFCCKHHPGPALLDDQKIWQNYTMQHEVCECDDTKKGSFWKRHLLYPLALKAGPVVRKCLTKDEYDMLLWQLPILKYIW
ncbi:hypothetical protein PIIN_06302 [Serendipita indica DSM 11827]|uniref:Uncharacterized protein n=1 Tax=Serendipita indica (strain DSM 11827) TaxID=1109443 RepID=G4TM25_SERID|nr:hypothetical protein PIIN_06302 [Serendipita indica DSM 11827]